MPTTKPLLLVADRPEDALTIRRALGDLGMAERMVHTPGTEHALAYLRCVTNEKPALILLDLNAAGTAGIEFLRAVKSDPSLGAIPVVVLSDSPQRQDVIQSFDLNVAGYIVKPTDYAALVEAMRIIQDYWSLSYLPAGPR